MALLCDEELSKFSFDHFGSICVPLFNDESETPAISVVLELMFVFHNTF